ncbi:DUF6114 domain-containing protein [Leifsonia sp. PS1209]|uniref:DUF6114 domain-containing protein n=1 Tax=Leifsonia sp. PS1209 TaxID=2724914 RepID=UPI001B33C4DD|nr:DUF6114 domain-containing protein [Leifsonia sp. PS1209]
MLLNATGDAGAVGGRRARAGRAEHASTSDRDSTTPTPTAWSRFSHWRRQRPFLGGLLIALGGVELFFSGQLDIGKIHVQLGIEGVQATIIPIVLVLLGVLIVTMPAHRIFYGVIALVVAVYSLVGVNLGGFFIGMLLSTVGGVLAVAWMPLTSDEAGGVPAGDPAVHLADEGADEGAAS